MKRSELHDAIVVITGASSGIGRATAHAFARSGATVVLASRRESALQETLQECERLGGRGIVVPTDVCEAAQPNNENRSPPARCPLWVKSRHKW